MSASIDISGQRFGMGTALRRIGSRERKALWLLQCDCGKQYEAVGSVLRSGRVKSCGCLLYLSKNVKHGHHKTPTYVSWESMRRRCEGRSNPKDAHLYADITYDPAWKTFANFLADMGVRPEGKTLDRIDGTRGYCKDNCRWATPKEQAQNRRSNRNLGNRWVCLQQQKEQ